MAVPMKRWFGIRHLRYFYKAWNFNRWWQSQGRFLGAFPNQADLDYLDKVWKGEK